MGTSFVGTGGGGRREPGHGITRDFFQPSFPAWVIEQSPPMCLAELAGHRFRRMEGSFAPHTAHTPRNSKSGFTPRRNLGRMH